MIALALVITGAGPLWAETRLPESLRRHVAANSAQPVDVIVQGTADQVAAIAARHGVRIKKQLSEGAVLEATGAQIEAMSADVHVSRDVEVRSLMSVTNEAIGADQVQAGLETLGAYTGKGIGVVLIDSGVWTSHRSLAGRVVVSKDFVGDGQTTDLYGHGTHIAATIAGSSPYPHDATVQTPFRGVAPGAHLISLRVIGADGTGRASGVIDALLWAVKNRARYNIRVINLSLGGPVEESYKTDPMCQAVERAVQAGIVVVAAAGNRGKGADGKSIYGAIESPGNDPYVITVGALNTKATARRSDDELATYSSKGPTLFDRLVKPDVVAPGNRIRGLLAPGSTLATEHPELVTGTGRSARIELSGTSMAAPAVSGAVASLLQAKRQMSAGAVRILLQYSAEPLRSQGLLGAGAGSINLVAARELQLRGTVTGTSVAGYLVEAGQIVFGSGDFWGTENILWGSARNILWGSAGNILWGSDENIFWGSAKNILWGSDENILWGSAKNILWGSDENILWGSDENILWGSAKNILWGSDENILWGSDENILWGSQIGD
jgi:serine protease AprX